jgi:hypothetical protein
MLRLAYVLIPQSYVRRTDRAGGVDGRLPDHISKLQAQREASAQSSIRAETDPVRQHVLLLEHKITVFHCEGSAGPFFIVVECEVITGGIHPALPHATCQERQELGTREFRGGRCQSQHDVAGAAPQIHVFDDVLIAAYQVLIAVEAQSAFAVVEVRAYTHTFGEPDRGLRACQPAHVEPDIGVDSQLILFERRCQPTAAAVYTQIEHPGLRLGGAGARQAQGDRQR